MGISVVILAASEAENLKLLIPLIETNLQKTGTSYEILVVDSKEPTDDTPAICAAYSSVRYVNQREPRYAGAFRTGISEAKEEYMLVLDADFSHNPERIPALYAKILEGYDLVIGSRYCEGGHSNDSKASHWMSLLLNFVMRLVIGVRARDISTSFRIYHTDQLRAVHLTCLNYEVLQEVILRMKKNKKSFSIAEVPITFEKRKYGESKRKLLRFILTYIRTLFRFLLIRMQKSPSVSD